MLRKSDNINKYTAHEMEEYRQAQRESELQATEDEAALAAKAEIILRGLQSKYGFSEAGAKETLRLIKNGVNMMTGNGILHEAIDAGRFGTNKAKQQAAMNAFDYYWK